jgi:hypothetical protein
MALEIFPHGKFSGRSAKRRDMGQGIWFEMSLDGGDVREEVDSFYRIALVDLEAARQRLVRTKRDDGQQGVAGQREILRGVDAPVSMVVLPPKTGVAFVVIEVFRAPVPPDRCGMRWLSLASRLVKKCRT